MRKRNIVVLLLTVLLLTALLLAARGPDRLRAAGRHVGR